MTRKKRGLWTFVFSLMPGAGEMYLGFMKRGVSTMCLFLGVFALSMIANVPEGLVLLPVIWFYSFFTVHNLAALPDEEFYQQEDQYVLLHVDRIPSIDKWERGQVKFLAAALIILGGWMLLGSAWDMLWGMMPDWLWNVASPIHEGVPQLVMAGLLIVFGVYLIRGKKAELDQQEQTTAELTMNQNRSEETKTEDAGEETR